MEKIVKCPKRQDCHYKLTPGTSNETSINLSNEVFKYIQPEEAPSDVAVEVSFKIYKDDFIKALCYIVNRLPLYKTGSGKSTEVTYSADLFASQYESINKFFGENSTAIYHAKLLNRGDGRIYLNDLNDNGFNIRRFLIESNSVIIFAKEDGCISLQLESGADIFEQYSTPETTEDGNKIVLAEKELKAYIYETVKYLSELDGLNSLVPYIATEIQPEVQIKISSTENTPSDLHFSLTGMFIETTEEGLVEKNTNKETGKPKPRWFTEKFTLDGHTVYLSGEWYGKDKDPQDKRSYNLTLKDFNTMLDACYPGMFTYSYEQNKHTLRGKQDNNDTYYEQTIYFGSPGTGKSFKIKDEILNGVNEHFIFRTTFHPDTDYASFVGCYKPATEHNEAATSQSLLDYNSLVEKLKEYLEVKPVNITRACVLFGFDYHDSIVRIQENNAHTIPQLIEDAYKPNTTYDSVMRGGMAAYESSMRISSNSPTITYKFTPQTFTNAYVKAWQNPTDNIYLVIEEINRGNCAQIFGDLFQLLDRNDDGVSEYPIKADADLTKYLQDKLGVDHEGIADGNIKLPANLHIIATMNTSDQSLFPMDSAFKRRWEWKYVPTNIKGDKKKVLKVESKEKTELFNREQEKKVLRLGMYEYDWSVFLEKINKCITAATHSDDKQLGFWFVKTHKGSNEIKLDTFVSKVIFYLWTDVFKDFGAKATNPFAFKTGNGDMVVCPFSSFFDPYTGEINLGQIHGFMYNLGIIPELEPEIQDTIENNLIE